MKFFPTIQPYMAAIFLTWEAKPRIGPLRSHATVTSFQAARRPNGAFSSGSFCPEVPGCWDQFYDSASRSDPAAAEFKSMSQVLPEHLKFQPIVSASRAASRIQTCLQYTATCKLQHKACYEGLVMRAATWPAVALHLCIF